MDAFFGYCSEGHLHPIRNEYTGMAKNQKSLFKTSMFRDDYVKEESVQDKWFIPLPPTNCPNLANYLPFERRRSRRNALPRDPVIIPFNANMGNEERTPISFLIQFEEHPDRLSETKEQGKMNLFNLIVDAYPALRFENLAEWSYEKLREMFLRELWNIADQEKAHEEFLRSRYPAFRGQTVSDFAQHWIHKFTFSTAFLTRNIAKELAERIPPKYEPILREFYDGAKWYMVYKKISEVEEEDTSEMSDESSGSPGPGGWPELFQTFEDAYFYTFTIALTAMGIGFGGYLWFWR